MPPKNGKKRLFCLTDRAEYYLSCLQKGLKSQGISMSVLVSRLIEQRFENAFEQSYLRFLIRENERKMLQIRSDNRKLDEKLEELKRTNNS